MKEIFNERVDATWKLALDENKKEIETQLDAKISYASGTNAKKELLKGLE